MIITEKFVFIHMHKTGGQTVNDIINHCMPERQFVGYHYPRAYIPDSARHLPVVGISRNPWDWYVSWYAFNRRSSEKSPLFKVVSESGQGNFRTTIENLIQLGSDRDQSKQHRNQLVEMLPNSLDGNRGIGLTKNCIREFADNDSGYYSWMFRRMCGHKNDAMTLVGQFENLQDDFLRIMVDLGVDEVSAMQAEFVERKRKNASQHSHYSHYYDEDLKALVAKKESSVVEQFDYGFDAVKPAGTSYDFSLSDNGHIEQNFQKLVGRESNYLLLNEKIDTDDLLARVEQFPKSKWHESERERLFDVHRDTLALLLVHFEDFKYKEPDVRELFLELRKDIQPVIDYISSYYQDNGFIVRILLAKLKSGGKIPHHRDAGFSLLNSHRIHLPLTTNDGVVFSVGGEKKNMRAGELWEINNGLDHAVENRGYDDRIHLIIDWMPNRSGESIASVLNPEHADDGAMRQVDATTLDTMVARGYQLHQAGEAAKAESQYRQVLRHDERHVIANNLLGLLCLQTKRFAEAVDFIETALAEDPNDAQAHANLGLAFKDLQKLEDAERHFHASLKIDPNNPRVYSNLGSTYMALRRIEDAIKCFKQALVIQPAFAEVHYNLGVAYMQLRRFEEAAASLQQSLTFKPDLADAKIKLQQALKAQRN